MGLKILFQGTGYIFTKLKMNRVAFKMFLKPGNEAEYQKRHDEIWPELKELFRRAGISDYSIFLDRETNFLFAVKQLDENCAQDTESKMIIAKWWAYMADIMDTNPDNSPVSIQLKEVFYMK